MFRRLLIAVLLYRVASSWIDPDDLRALTGYLVGFLTIVPHRLDNLAVPTRAVDALALGDAGDVERTTQYHDELLEAICPQADAVVENVKER